nr:uncharacterized protein LOC113809595 [Penaeus vannamei]
MKGISKLYNLTPDWAVVKPRPIRSRVPSVCVVLPSQLISSQTTGTDHRLKMAGDAGVDSSQFKGMARYFNSSTMTGRANVRNFICGTRAGSLICPCASFEAAQKIF